MITTKTIWLAESETLQSDKNPWGQDVLINDIIGWTAVKPAKDNGSIPPGTVLTLSGTNQDCVILNVPGHPRTQAEMTLDDIINLANEGAIKIGNEI